MLTSVCIEVKRGSVSHVAAGLIGNDGNVIADFVLIGPAFLRVKRIADLNIGRPGNTSIRAPRVE
jgi:hypothetical protein